MVFRIQVLGSWCMKVPLCPQWVDSSILPLPHNSKHSLMFKMLHTWFASNHLLCFFSVFQIIFRELKK